MRLNNFRVYFGNIGVDVQNNIIIAQTFGEGIFQYVCAVQSGLRRCRNVMVYLNREGYAQCGQFFHCLFLVLFCFCFVYSCRSFTVYFQTQFFCNQFGVFGTVAGVAQTLHGIEVVFTVHRIDSVAAFPYIGEVQTVVPGQSERFVCDCSVPVGIRCSVLVHLVVVKVILEGVFGSNARNHVIMELVAFVFADGLNVAFGQINVIQLTGLIQLVSNVGRLYHSDGNGIEQGAILIPVHWVFGQNFFVALNVGGHGVAAVVPHIFVVHGFYAVRTAQLVYHALRQRIQTNVSTYGIKVWGRVNTGVNDSLIIRKVNSYHFTEFRTFSCCQRVRFLFGEGFCILVIFLCAFNHFKRHRGVGRIVFVEVEYPFQTGCKILRVAVCFFLSVHVNPFYTVANVEGPGFSAVLGSPFICNTRLQFAVAVYFQQTVGQVTQVFMVL